MKKTKIKEGVRKTEPIQKPVAPVAEQFWLGAAALVVATVLVYFRCIPGQFIWDDGALLTDCAAIKAGNGLFSIWMPGQLPDYVPVTGMSFWLEWRLWGMNPAGYHVTNILLHALNAVLLWRTLRALKIPFAWAGALLFAAHPVCVASVAWIVERKNTLSMVFYLISALLYLRFDETSKKSFYALSLVAFALALLAKISVAVLPPVLLLLVWWRRNRITMRDALRTLPYFALAVACGFISIAIQNKATASFDSLPVRVIGGTWALWFYLGKIVWPAGLTIVYPRWAIDAHSAAAYLPGLAAIGAAILFWRFRSGWGRPFLFAFGYFVIALGPVLGVFKMAFMDFSRAADHLQYLAVPGIVALAAAGICKFFGKSKRAPEICVAGVVSVLCVLTWRHEGAFASNHALWQDNLAKNPESWPAELNVGAELENETNIDAAIPLYEKVLKKEPYLPLANFDLGNAFEKKGRYDDAIQLLEITVKLKPDYSDALCALGVAYDKKARYDEAIANLEAGIKRNPTNASARKNLGLVLARKGRMTNAVDELRESLRFSGPKADTLDELGNLLGRMGRTDEARDVFEQTLKLDPAIPGAQNGLGAVLDHQGRLDEAITHFQEAIRLKPDFARAHFNLGNALARKGRRNEAISELKLALKYQPNYPDAAQQLRNLTSPASSQ